MGVHREDGAGPARAARLAVRTTLAACAGFFVCLYGLDRPVAATYALFGVVSMAALSHIPGTGRRRAAVLVRTVPVAWALVSAGTCLAVRTWSAVAGMLLIGFVLAFAAAAGPRAAGAAPGLQLLYILPCFPPYAPDTLAERLAGVSFGLALLVLAEVFVLPEPAAPTYRELAAGAAGTAARCAAELARGPYPLSGASAGVARASGEALRPLRVAEAERPAGPGLRDRALGHAGLAARTLLGRLVGLPAPPPGGPPGEGAELLDAVAVSAAGTAGLLRGPERGSRADGPAAPDAAADALRCVRARTLAAAADERPTTAARGLRRAALLEVADAAMAFSTAARLAVEGRRARAPAVTDPGRFWYAGQSAPRLWWHRLAAHAGPRSVYFQNAVRISLALAAARTIAGLESLPHGFWAMLAVLSLTRTTASQTRATVRRALLGTLVGAVVTAAVLALVGGRTTVYAVSLPFVMLVAFRVGPVRGVGWAQGMFTLVVAFVFAQLAPVTWRLAEIRIMDVVVGSLIGVVFGLLAWPRGAQEELRRAVALMLSRAAETVEGATAAAALGGPGAVPDDRPLQLALSLAESAYAQYQSEPGGTAEGAGSAGAVGAAGGPPDWQARMMTGHHVLWGSRRLLGPGGPALGAQEGAWLCGRAAEVAGLLRGMTPGAPGPGPVACPPGAPPEVAPPRFFTVLAWLDSLTADVRRTAPHAATG